MMKNSKTNFIYNKKTYNENIVQNKLKHREPNNYNRVIIRKNHFYSLPPPPEEDPEDPDNYLYILFVSLTTYFINEILKKK
jgi:hypothetical protein